MLISQATYFETFDKLRAEFYQHLSSHTKWVNRSDISVLFSEVARQDPLLAASLLPKIFDAYPENPLFTQVVCGLITRSAIKDGVLQQMANHPQYAYAWPTFIFIATMNAWRGKDWEDKEIALAGYIQNATGLAIKWESGSTSYLPQLAHALMGPTWASLYGDTIETTEDAYNLVWIAKPPLQNAKTELSYPSLPGDLAVS